MTEADARRIFLVRALEESDATGGVLTAEVRTEAAKAAGGTALLEGGSLDKGAGEEIEGAEAAFLAERARWLEGRMRTMGIRLPGTDGKGIPGWLGPALVVGVLLVGFFSAHLGGEGAELNILALPLLGILGWNLAVYVLALIGLMTGAGGRRSGILTSMARRMGKVGKAGDEAPVAAGKLGRGEELRLAVEWFEEDLPVQSTRLGVILHVAAAALALGGVAGLFYEGWSVEYVAVWESTLFDAGSLGTFFGYLFGAASWVTGIEIPVGELAEIQRGSGLEHRGGDALPWLQLYGATMGIFVVVPRLVFAVIYRWHLARLRADFPLSAGMRPYLAEVLRGFKGESLVAEVVPFAYAPDPRVRDGVRGLLHALWGGGIYPEFRATVEYGDEEEYLDSALEKEPKYAVLLMNFSATPEEEAHGYLGKGLREKIAASGNGGGRSLLVLLDGSGFVGRFGGLPEFGRRVAERKATWERVMGAAGLRVATVNLPGDGEAGGLAEVAGRVWTASDVSKTAVERM